jgi:hypothetical protein
MLKLLKKILNFLFGSTPKTPTTGGPNYSGVTETAENRCYQYECINRGSEIVKINMVSCEGIFILYDAKPGVEELTPCVREIPYETIFDYQKIGVSLTPASVTCGNFK